MDDTKKKNTKNIWEHQREEECKATWRKGGGGTNVIEEDGADVAEMWLRMQARGIIGATVMHSAGTRIDETRAIAMMKNAQKCPRYMNISESNQQLKKLNEQLAELEAIKEERSKYDGNN